LSWLDIGSTKSPLHNQVIGLKIRQVDLVNESNKWRGLRTTAQFNRQSFSMIGREGNHTFDQGIVNPLLKPAQRKKKAALLIGGLNRCAVEDISRRSSDDNSL
jgi:hypothetical protein